MLAIYADLPHWPSKDAMAQLFQSAGLRVNIGVYSIRLPDYPDLVFQEYGGDLGDPTLEAWFDTLDEAIEQAQFLSNLWSQNHIAHVLEVYDDDDRETPHRVFMAPDR